MAIGGSIFIVTLVIIQKSKYEDIGVSRDLEHYVKVFNELINSMIKMNKVTSAEIVQHNKRARVTGGLYITFNSKENVKHGDYINLLYTGHNRPFKVVGVKVVGDLLEVSAKEVGYWAHKLDQIPDLDLRSLIGLEVLPITDTDEIKEINEQSCWC